MKTERGFKRVSHQSLFERRQQRIEYEVWVDGQRDRLLKQEWKELRRNILFKKCHSGVNYKVISNAVRIHSSKASVLKKATAA